MLHGPDLDQALIGRRIGRAVAKPFAALPAGDEAADLRYLDLHLDGGGAVRIWRSDVQGHVALGVFPYDGPAPADPGGGTEVELSASAPWAWLAGATIPAVAQEGAWVPVPPPAPPPEPSGDDAFDAWRYGPEYWAAWHFADEDPKEAYVLRELLLDLGGAGRLGLTASLRPDASAFSHAAVRLSARPPIPPATFPGPGTRPPPGPEGLP